MPNKVIIVVAPHMDDEVLGCGGVISRHKSMGDKVIVVFVAHRIYNHHFNQKKNEIEINHALKAKALLKYDKAIFLGLNDERLDACAQDIIIPLEKCIKQFMPSIVYTPFKGDNNQDHRAVFDAIRVILRPMATDFIKEVNMYEVASSTDQSPPLKDNAFLPNYYVDIKDFIDKKIKALKYYETEKREYPHPRSTKALKILAQKRGTEIGYEYAEAFVNVRRKWDR